MQGFFKRVLIVDVTARSATVQDLTDGVLARGLGGKGLGLHLLNEHSLVGVDPLSPDNPLIFTVGPLTDTRIPGSCRYGVYTKSPQTGFFSEAYSGGKLAERISRTGFDAVVIKGASDEPLFLEITEEGALFHDAADLWGKETYETEDAVLERYGSQGTAGAAVIGTAGERMVPFAIIANDYWRCAGRTGAGAVLGSKRIKAVVFRGTKKRPLADEAGIAEFARKMYEANKDHAATVTYRTYGTPIMVSLLNGVGAFPTRYWRQGRSSDLEKINAEALLAECSVKPKACPRCFLACGKVTTVTKGRREGVRIEGPEYETIYVFGGLCQIGSIEEIVYLNDLCDRLGIDTISAGNLVALAMEAASQGRLDEEVPYGDVDAAERVLKSIAVRQGLGEVLALGIVGASRVWGMEDQAIHVKGLEPAGYDPRVLNGMGLAYATSDRGACHLRTTFYKPELAGMIAPDAVEGKAALLVDFEDRCNLFDALILCRFFRDFYPWELLAEVVSLSTGLQLDQKGLQAVARSIKDDARRFNIREGLTKDDDLLPSRFFAEPLPETGATLDRAAFDRMLSEYYQLRGWDDRGHPLP